MKAVKIITFFLLVNSTVYAKANKLTITGKVTDSQGRPLNKVCIILSKNIL